MAAVALLSRACSRRGGGGGGGHAALHAAAFTSAAAPLLPKAAAAAAPVSPVHASTSLCITTKRTRQNLPRLPERQVRHHRSRYMFNKRTTAPHYGPPPWIQPLLPWKTARNKAIPKPPTLKSLEPVDLHINVKRTKRVDVEAIDREIVRMNSELLIRAGEYAKGIGILEAIKMLKALDLHPDPSLRLAVKLDTAPGVQHLRASLRFPKPLSLGLRFLVFAEGEEATRALEAGATHVGGEKLIHQAVRGELQYDRVLCTPELFRKVTIHLARILGPKGLMPTARRGTVTSDIAKAINDNQGVTEFVGDAENVMALEVAKNNFADEEIMANINAVLRSLKPLGTPNTVTLSTSNGLELMVDLKDFMRVMAEMDDAEAQVAA